LDSALETFLCYSDILPVTTCRTIATNSINRPAIHSSSFPFFLYTSGYLHVRSFSAFAMCGSTEIILSPFPPFFLSSQKTRFEIFVVVVVVVVVVILKKPSFCITNVTYLE